MSWNETGWSARIGTCFFKISLTTHTQTCACARMCVCAHKHTHTVTKCCSGKFCQTRMVNTRNVTNLDKQENLHQTSVLMSGSTVSPTSPEIPRSELSPSLLWGTSSHLQHSQFPASMDFLLKGRNTVHTQTKERDTAS